MQLYLILTTENSNWHFLRNLELDFQSSVNSQLKNIKKSLS